MKLLVITKSCPSLTETNYAKEFLSAAASPQLRKKNRFLPSFTPPHQQFPKCKVRTWLCFLSILVDQNTIKTLIIKIQ